MLRVSWKISNLVIKKNEHDHYCNDDETIEIISLQPKSVPGREFLINQGTLK